MSDFTYAANGGVAVFGKSHVKVEYIYHTKFNIGKVAYSRQAAVSKGRLEGIVIKSYKIIFHLNDVIYTDTLNGLWNERHLCSKSEAVDLAIRYHDRLAAHAEAFLGYH